MNKIFFIANIILAVLIISSCGTSRNNVSKSTVKTFTQPCHEFAKCDSLIRAWAVGKSDSEATAKKKATTMASAQLAEMLEKTVTSTIQEYIGILSEGDQSASNNFLLEKTSISIKKTLHGAITICDQWTKDEKTGQYTNYIVMEINPEVYIKSLNDEVNSSGKSINKELLHKIFIEKIKELE